MSSSAYRIAILHKMNQIFSPGGKPLSRQIPLFLLKMLFLSFTVTTALLLLLAFLLYRLRWDSTLTAAGVYAVYFLSCFLPAFLAGKTMRSRRLLWGLAIGLLYFLLLLAASALMRTGLFAGIGRLLTVLGICAAAGALGGVLS